jgi:anti-sigma factor RsiW
MTHDKFIELLNLYLDGALPPAEASALEREIHGNVQRRRIYRQYCQMQKGCAQLSERFRDEAAPAAQFRSGAVVESRRRVGGEWLRSLALVAGGALAACGVLVAVRVSVAHNPGPSVVQGPAAPAAVTAGAVPAAEFAASQQTVPATTPVAMINSGVFGTPWAAGQRSTRRVVGFTALAPLTHPLELSVPKLSLPSDTRSLPVDLQPYGTEPGAALRMEELEAAAFQFQR